MLKWRRKVSQTPKGERSRVNSLVDVNISLVEQMVEHIDSINRCLTLLPVAKDQIDPLKKAIID
jgi:hypothetical protein